MVYILVYKYIYTHTHIDDRYAKLYFKGKVIECNSLNRSQIVSIS